MHRHVRAALLCACLLALACSDDGTRPEPKPGGFQWPNLTQKDHVLLTLEVAMNQRDITHYLSILDPNDFVFFFAPGDVGNGIPESWGFAEEMRSVETMFNKGGGKNNNPILSIELDLDIENASWVEFNSVQYPGVFETLVGYKLRIDTENSTQYLSRSTSRAQFRIRQNDQGQWMLVEWYDHYTPLRLAPSSPGGIEPTTWGELKDLYG